MASAVLYSEFQANSSRANLYLAGQAVSLAMVALVRAPVGPVAPVVLVALADLDDLGPYFGSPSRFVSFSRAVFNKGFQKKVFGNSLRTSSSQRFASLLLFFRSSSTANSL